MSSIDIIKQFQHQLWANKDLASIDAFFANNVKIHSPLDITVGAEKLKIVMQQWFNAFPDLEVIWDDILESGNKVISQWHAKGTHIGEFKNIAATNKTVNYTGCTIYKLDKHKISQYWAYVDINNILMQIAR